MSKLNQYQQAAVDSTAPNKAIVAGAGSGKTHTLTHIISKDIERGMKPDTMVAITFTRNASKELKERLERLIGDNAQKIRTSTIHGFCLDILDDWIEALGFDKGFALYDQEDKKDIINGIIKDLQYKITYAEYLECVDTGKHTQESRILTDEYRERMMMYNAIDLDMILMLTFEVLSRIPGALKATRERCKAFYIDEFQDTNYLQLIIIKAIDPAHMVVIGDPDQSIYEWNHAKPEYMVNITETFPGIELHKLVNNYRSTTQIINVSNRVIRHNVDRIDKDLIAQFSGDPVNLEFNGDESAELEYILKSLNGKYSDNAVICRNNKRAQMVANYLTSKDIPVNLISAAADIFKKSEIRKFIKLLQLIHNPDDDYAFLQVINWPYNRMSEKELKSVQEKAASTMQSLYSVTFNGVNSATVAFLTRVESLHQKHKHITVTELETLAIDMFDVIATYAAQYRTFRIVEFEYLRREIQRWRIFQGYMNRPQHLTAFLRYVKLRDIQENINNDREAVYVMTVHGSKGLEFPNVFVVGLNEREFPSGQSENIEEERRLLYVAMTRAMHKLHLTRSNTKAVNWITQMTIPSRFIAETGLSNNQIKIQEEAQ